jgi:hypothetical protein
MDLKEAAEELAAINRKIELAAEATTRLNERKGELEKTILPDLFQQAGVKSIKLENGATVTLSIMAEGSLPKDPEKRKQALEWLVANGYEDFIEVSVTASFVKGHHSHAVEVYEKLRTDNQAKVALEEGIHPMTLKSQIKKRVSEGGETPLDLLGIAVFPRARFTKKGE